MEIRGHENLSIYAESPKRSKIHHYKVTLNQKSLYDNLQSDRRIVPEHIPRPHYADHPQGFPLSEQKLKGNTYIRQLDADEIDGEQGEVFLLQ